MLQWGRDFANKQLKRVADTALPNGIRVSTVWLGLDHALFEKRPKIFESMVFSPFTHKLKVFAREVDIHEDLTMERYSTEKEAICGHKRLCEKYRTYKTAEDVLG